MTQPAYNPVTIEQGANVATVTADGKLNVNASLTGDAAIATLIDLVRVQNALLRAIVFQLGNLTIPPNEIRDLSPFMSDDPLL